VRKVSLNENLYSNGIKAEEEEQINDDIDAVDALSRKLTNVLKEFRHSIDSHTKQLINDYLWSDKILKSEAYTMIALVELDCE